MNPFNVLPRFENHFANQTVRFQVQLEVDGYFSAQKFSHLQPPQAGRVGTNLQFLNPILQIQLQNTCWASPKPDVQHKNALVSHLNDRWISKFLGEKFVLWKSSLINLISHKTGTIASGFEGKKRKYHLLKIWVLLWYALSRAVHMNRTSQVRFSPSKPDLIRPKNTCLIVICFLQAFIEPWESNDRLHEIPGDDPQVGEPENAAERGQESHAERTAPQIWDHVDTQNRNQ